MDIIRDRVVVKDSVASLSDSDIANVVKKVLATSYSNPMDAVSGIQNMLIKEYHLSISDIDALLPRINMAVKMHSSLKENKDSRFSDSPKSDAIAKAEADLKKADVDWDKADTDWNKTEADYKKARADWEKARIDWKKAKAVLEKAKTMKE